MSRRHPSAPRQRVAGHHVGGRHRGEQAGLDPEYDLLFLADSGPDRPLRIPFDAVSAALGTPEIWLDSAGAIDGITVDSAGRCVAGRRVGAGGLLRHDVEGFLAAVVLLLASQVTSACFVERDPRTWCAAPRTATLPARWGSLFGSPCRSPTADPLVTPPEEGPSMFIRKMPRRSPGVLATQRAANRGGERERRHERLKMGAVLGSG